MIPAFSNITEDGFSLLEKILENPNYVPADFFIDEPTVDGQLELLLDSKLVSVNESDEFSITELGRAALKAYEKEKERRLLLEKQREEELATFKSIAETAKKSANYAKKQAEAAQTQAKLAEETAQRAIANAEKARRDALFAKIISVIAIIAPILYDFIIEKLPTLLQMLSELSAK